MKLLPLVALALLGMVSATALVSSTETATFDDQDIFCFEFVPNEKATWAPGKPLAKWANQNPGERDQWSLFAALICQGDDPSPPSLSSLHGKTLVAAGKLALPETVPAPTTTTTTTTEPPPSEPAYWNEDWDSALVPTDWLTSRVSFPSLESPYSLATYAFVSDPFGTNENTVLRLRAAYDSRLSTDYSARQLVSLYRGASNSYSGYQTINEETWYRVRLGFPIGNVFSSGQFTWLVEWHTDDSTQAQGGNSPGLAVEGDYPLNPNGSTNPRLILRWASGTPSNPTYTYWPSSGTGTFNQWLPIPIEYGRYYDMVFHVVWSLDPTIGKLEWWVDGIRKVSRNMITQYANPNNFNNQSYHTFGIYNYRYNVTNTTDVYFSQTAAGKTATSIGFAGP